MHKIFVTRPIPSDGIDILKSIKKSRLTIRKKDSVISRKELLKGVKGAHAILSILTDKIDPEVMDSAGQQLKIIANYAVGFNNIDVKEAQKRGIIVTNTPAPELTGAVADHTFGLILALSKRIVEADSFTRQGKYKGWGPQLLLGNDIHHKTIGIIGMGRIGQAVAQRANGFDMKILYTNTKKVPSVEKAFKAKKATLQTLLKKSDIVSIHVPLLPSTHHLITKKELQLMKKSAFIINTARGPIIKEIDLLRALKKKQIAGASLDVFECEPAIDCNIKDNLALKKLPNVVLTPHTASASWEARQSMARMSAKNIKAVLSGKKPLNQVSIT